MKFKTLTSAALLVLAMSIMNVGYASDCSSDSSPATKTTAQVEVAKPMTIVETAVSAGSFKTLVAAVEAAGLVETLSGEGPFTVFAPTDDAFAALPEGALEALLKDKEALTSVLTYHVVSGSLDAEKVVGQKTLETVNGQSFKITVGEDGVMINNARVVSTDIVCSNGVVHVIDAVILPEMEG